MKLPDGNKPIKIGDPSFIYKGVYNPIYWIGKDPYRPRVETLVLKNGDSIYMRIKDNIDKFPSDKRTHSYSVPGGSLDSDSTKIQQAEAETNEEALIKVSLLYNTGVQYYDLYEPGFILKGGDTPLEYVGSITDVFIGIYNGSYDKSLVEEKDLDPDMAENGKFYKIKDIAKYLRKEHITALLQSQFVSTELKAILNNQRADTINESTSPIVVPDGYIFHGSTYNIDEFKPMSLDLGNALEEPGWSTFCFGKYQEARLFGFMRALTKKASDVDVSISPRMNKDMIELSKDDLDTFEDNFDLASKVPFYVYTIDSKGLDIGIGNDSSLKEYTFRASGVKPVAKDFFSLSMLDLKDNIEIVDNYDELLTDNSDFKSLHNHDYNKEVTVRNKLLDAISKGELKPGDDVVKYMELNGISFDNDDISLPDITIDIDEPVLENIDWMSITLEESFPIECYGLPERKAYPMPDEKHVRSAIKFFNYVKKDEEKELASKINEMIKKYKITDISIGDKNRFKKYYKPINESYTLEDFSSAINHINGKIKHSKSVTEKYELYERMKGTIRMMVASMESGVFSELNPDIIPDLVNKSYNTLEEISESQLAILKESAIPKASRSIISVLEADDDKDDDENTDEDTEGEEDEVTDYEAIGDDDDDESDEEVTDYEDMANEGDEETEDESDAEPADDGEDTEDTDVGDEDVTDYEAMADEGDEETEDTPDDADASNEDTPDDTEGETEEEPTDDTEEGGEEEPTDYEAMADEGDEESEDDGDTGEDEGTDDTDTDDTSSETSEDENTDGEMSENNNHYNNNEIRTFFLLNSFLSMREAINDVLDSISGVILPTPDANKVLAKTVNNLQSIKSFVEKFIQFHFSNTDYAFNLYYYNILISALKMNLKLLESAVSLGETKKTKTNK